MVSALPSSNWMVTTVSGAACAIAGTASTLPAARATAAPIRDDCLRTLSHLVIGYPPAGDLPCRGCARALRCDQSRRKLIHGHLWLGTLPNQTCPCQAVASLARHGGRSATAAAGENPEAGECGGA